MKKMISLIVALILSFSLSTVAFADSNYSTEEITNNVDPLALGYKLYYEVVSSTELSTIYYGPYRDGPTIEQPGIVSINQGLSIDRGFYAALSGDYPLGEASISAEVGFSVNCTTSYETSYSTELSQEEYSQGFVKTIQYRPKYKIIKVVTQFIQEDTYTGEKTVLSNHTAYVNKFNNWSYGWRYGY